MRLGLRVALGAGVCGAALTWSGLAAAQTASGGVPPATASSQDTTVGEVVVTAQKREQRIFEVPLPVQAIGKAELQESGATKVSDLVSAIPGASVVSSSTPGFETVQIRGISSGTTGDGLVGYYIDDTPFGIPNLQLTPPSRLLDLDRVEVIRGPSGTLYGQGSMGGTIKLVTTKPDTNKFSGTLQGEASGTDGGAANGAADFAVNIPIVQDKLAVRLTGGYEYLSGYADVPELGLTDANNYHGFNIRATALFRPTQDLEFEGFIWHIINKQDFSSSLTPHNATTSSLVPQAFPYLGIAGTGGRRGYTDVDADIYSGTVRLHTAVGDITSNTSYIGHKLDFVDPLLNILVNDSTFKTHSLTEEVRLNSLPSAPFTYQVGVSYRDATINSNINYFEDLTALGFPGVTVPIIDTVGPLSTKSYSIYGEVSKAFLDGKLEPTVGLRYFHDDRSSTGLDIPTGVIAGTSASYESTNPRFNLKYHITDDGLVYFNAAKGFRSGALQTQSQATAANVTLGLPAGTITTQVQPDSLWTYEVGSRWRLVNRTVQVEASYYHTDWSNVLVQFASAAVISLANAGDAELDGVDGSVVWKTPVQGLSLAGNGNINSSRFTSVVGALAASTAVKVGGQLPNVPRSTFTVSADYKRPVDWFGGSEASAYLGYSFRDKQGDATTKGLYSGQLNDLTLRAGLKKNNVRVDAFIDNATNEDRPSVLTSTSLQVLYPRRIGIQVGYDF